MPKSLLVADDSVTMQKVVAMTFAAEDFKVVAVGNGDDALARARELRPDVILADVVMPQKNGYELCAAVKADATLRNVRVLLLAATSEAFDEVRARAAQADGHIVKPFESGALIAKVKELAERPRITSAPTPAVGAPIYRPPSPVPPVPAPPPEPKPPYPELVPDPELDFAPLLPDPPTGLAAMPAARAGAAMPELDLELQPEPESEVWADIELEDVDEEPAAAGQRASSSVRADGGETLLREALSRASREVIERVAWEVVPQLAEVIIREQLERLVKSREQNR